MAQGSSIEWTDATWNPTTGCTEVSEGCKNCYAREMHARLTAMGQKKYQKPFHVFQEWDMELPLPLRWKKPRKIFVNSMSDLFHEDATFDFITRVFNIMGIAKWHTFQILTKRPRKMQEFVKYYLDEVVKESRLPNHIWLGTSVEMQKYTSRIDILREIPAIRIVSFEPLLEEVTPNLQGIQQAIVGGESGHLFRPIKKEWVYTIQKAALGHACAFFFKQWGGRTPKAQGRELDGKTYDGYPELEKIA